ncbi:MAG: DNA repair protein RecO [Candidatus Blackburnbacteria bacterium]|nr:DNA repair protein RecO [Candidatus Blackburnbacteria bacterium]
MEYRTFSTEGIILARRNFGEADRLLTVFSKHYGKIRAIAKGVRRPSSRKRGSLELFSCAKLLFTKGRNIDLITDVELKDGFSSWRKDLLRVGIAYHLCEVVNRLTVEGQEHREIFELLFDSLGSLAETDYWQLHGLVYSFKVFVLQELGFLERERSAPGDIDRYIESIIDGPLRTKRFLKNLKNG